MIDYYDSGYNLFMNNICGCYKECCNIIFKSCQEKNVFWHNENVLNKLIQIHSYIEKGL